MMPLPRSKTNNSNRMTKTYSYFIFLGCVLYTIIALYTLHASVIVKDNPTKNNETNMPVTTMTMKKRKNNRKSNSNSFASVIEKDNMKNKTSLSLSLVVSKDVNII